MPALFHEINTKEIGAEDVLSLLLIVSILDSGGNGGFSAADEASKIAATRTEKIRKRDQVYTQRAIGPRSKTPDSNN